MSAVPVIEPGRPVLAVPCAIIRGGSSKGVFLLDEHLPRDPAERDRLLLQLMGSPDPRQIDGLGGADPLTSKVAIVSRSSREGIDVEYESLEVGIAEAQVTHGLMCGNLLAGVGHFAIAEGLVKAESPLTVIHIHCRSNRQTIVARIPVDAAGLPGETPVNLLFYNPGGAISGRLLPLGAPLSRLSFRGYPEVAVSIVDAGTLYAFVRADSLGLAGNEAVAALDADTHLRDGLESLRRRVAGCVNEHSPPGRPGIDARLVKVAIVSPPAAGQDDADIVARVVNPAGGHKAYAVSGGICLAAAAAIPGTLVNAIFPPQESPFALRIAHPGGVMALRTCWARGASGVAINAAGIERSARLILRGTAYVSPAPVASEPDALRLDSLEAVAP